MNDSYHEHGDSGGNAGGKLPAGMRPAALNEREAATYLAISPRKLWELASCGKVPCIRIGAAKRYRVTDLDAFLAKLAAIHR